jgi:alpha-mannosidase
MHPACEPNVVLSALKKSCDGKRWIIRLFESEGRKTKTSVEWSAAGVRFTILMKPFSVRTVAVDLKTKKVAEVSILEE